MASETYTHGHHASVLRSHTWRTAENSAPNLVPRLRAGQSLLDVGCGPGTITIDLAARVAPGTVVGVDQSAEVIQVAAAAASAAGSDHVSFRVGDIYNLEFEDDSFDVVHAHQVLQHLADPVRALVEMRRVCRPGGVVAVRDSDYSSFSWAPLDPLLDQWLDRYRTLARANGGEPDAGRFLLQWCRDAGFSEVEPGASVWCFATEADRQWWGGLWADRLVQSDLAAQLVDAGLASTDDLDQMSAAFRRWALDPSGWFAVLHGEAFARP